MRNMLVAFACSLAVAAGTPVGIAPAQAAPGAGKFNIQTLHFATHIGAHNEMACDIIGDLYAPVNADSKHRVPAILTTNGFGQSKEYLRKYGNYYAAHGYMVLAYSGLGFGGSGCRVTMDDPEYDGKAAGALIDFLGGKDGVAFRDVAHRIPVPGLPSVVHDRIDHAGRARHYDPRVGMVGASYGGHIQFTTASVDSRLDAISPAYTWNDLTYSLGPNHVAPANGVVGKAPGVGKLLWGLGLFGTGMWVSPLRESAYTKDPGRLSSCPNFVSQACQLVGESLPRGFATADLLKLGRRLSVSSYAKRVRIPVLLVQGEQDTLFDLNEALATYRALHQQGTEVKMIWDFAGHSVAVPEPGSHTQIVDPAANYVDARQTAWFDHYLRDSSVDTGPRFAYYRDWIPFTGNPAKPYGTEATPKLGSPRSWRLSGDGRLVSKSTAVTPGTLGFDTGILGLPTSTAAVPMPEHIPLPDMSVPGTFASWTTDALAKPLDIAGIPELTVRIGTERPLNGSVEDAIVVFCKLYDVAPNGSQTEIYNLSSPARITDNRRPVRIALSGIVHRLAPGHRLRFTLAGGDLGFRGGLVAHHLTIAAGPDQKLTVPAL